MLFGGKGTRSVTAYPLRATILELGSAKDDNGEAFHACSPYGDDAAVHVLFSVSKRHFRHAVDRNRVKRQMREMYRQNIMHDLRKYAEMSDMRVAIALVWIAGRKYSSEDIAQSMKKLMRKLVDMGVRNGKEVFQEGTGRG